MATSRNAAAVLAGTPRMSGKVFGGTRTMDAITVQSAASAMMPAAPAASDQNQAAPETGASGTSARRASAPVLGQLRPERKTARPASTIGITMAAHGSAGVSLTLASAMAPQRPWPTAVIAKATTRATTMM